MPLPLDHNTQSLTLYLGGWTDDQIAANECANRIVNRAREYRRLFGNLSSSKPRAKRRNLVWKKPQGQQV